MLHPFKGVNSASNYILKRDSVGGILGQQEQRLRVRGSSKLDRS